MTGIRKSGPELKTQIAKVTKRINNHHLNGKRAFVELKDAVGEQDVMALRANLKAIQDGSIIENARPAILENDVVELRGNIANIISQGK